MKTIHPEFVHKSFVYVWVGFLNLVILLSMWWVGPAGYQKQSSVAQIPFVANRQPAVLPSNAVSGTPTHLHIDSLGIDLPVLDGIYNPTDQSWSLSADKAHFATISMPINTATGTTLLYGHNNKQVFYNLRKITPGTQVKISTNNGYIFSYTFAELHNVAPTDTSVFSFDGAPTLVIQTCTGTWNETRGMYTFKLSKVEKA